MVSEIEMLKEIVEIIAPRREQRLRRSAPHERVIAEFVGTFFFVFTIGVSASGAGYMAPVAAGLVLAVQVYTFGAVSGGFFNPAIVLAVLMSGRQKVQACHAILYVLAELVGAILGGLCAYAGTGATFYFDYELTRGWGTSLELEVLFTMALCLTVLTVSTSNDSPSQYFGFAIGMTVTGGALASGGLNQSSFNPAVTVGMNVANYANSATMQNPSGGAWALFILAPLLGGALAAAVFCATRGNEYSGFVEAASARRSAGDAEAARQSASATSI